MNRRRQFLAVTGAMLVLGVIPAAHAQRALPAVTVYKSPTCGCCGDWVTHMRDNGFKVETHDLTDLAPIRRKWGVPDELTSCHTAQVGGYTIEGHVPAADIKRLLRERPKARGLAVPGMVPGSPGMEQGTAQPYSTILFGGGSYRVFERH